MEKFKDSFGIENEIQTGKDIKQSLETAKTLVAEKTL